MVWYDDIGQLFYPEHTVISFNDVYMHAGGQDRRDVVDSLRGIENVCYGAKP